MKRLLSDGLGDCYQLSHVFRQGEIGSKHNPEFMMAEWYRLGFAFEELIEETVQFVRIFLGNLPFEVLSYRDTFKRYAGFDYVTSSNKQLLSYLSKKNIEVYPSVIEEGKDALLNLILGLIIEPKLGENGLFVLAYYPSTQAALAKTKDYNDEKVAERFEIYFKGMELANGYHELADALEQRQRLIQANLHRIALGKSSLPIDERFLDALEKGLPDCCGVAVGFDRLMMLRHKTSSIDEVIPFAWNSA
jgi:lysyl-tRNA synthetase class 2